jgi:hypothetical protein
VGRPTHACARYSTWPKRSRPPRSCSAQARSSSRCRLGARWHHPLYPIIAHSGCSHEVRKEVAVSLIRSPYTSHLLCHALDASVHEPSVSSPGQCRTAPEPRHAANASLASLLFSGEFSLVFTVNSQSSSPLDLLSPSLSIRVLHPGSRRSPLPMSWCCG